MSGYIPGAPPRAVVENVSPAVDGGRFAVKRCVGDIFTVEADCFVDGHDHVRAVLRYRCEGTKSWTEVDMKALGNDRWRAQFALDRVGIYEYCVSAWPDAFLTWRNDFERRTAREDMELALLSGAMLLADAAGRAPTEQAAQLAARQSRLENTALGITQRRALALDPELAELVAPWTDRSRAAHQDHILRVIVDIPRARFSAWYEMFPRSASANNRHGTFDDCIALLPYIADMGFDVLYLPPIHPIGVSYRKGPNNTLKAGDGDPGSPWAIGSNEGGHKAIHPQLGDLDSFTRLVAAARASNIELALDIAFQCSPDHPYIREHPDWFRKRPDGSIQYAENPPKKYQDIYPFDFESQDWLALWIELKSVFEHWISHGVRIFRVDNPHTKPFAFWERVITELKRAHPDVLFLSEAFTRPRVMHRLAKLGFSQSYTYFPWRNTREEIEEYFTELSHGPGREYFRPNAWPNTPDILTGFLQDGGRPAFIARLVLAATLSANYGIYGPAFELQENEAISPGSEEYLNSEKYQLRVWNRSQTGSLSGLIALVNRARRAHPALQDDSTLRFIDSDNPRIVAYIKATADYQDIILVAVNLDAHRDHSAWLDLPPEALKLQDGHKFEVEDLLSGDTYEWRVGRNFVALKPTAVPAHIFHLRIGTLHG